MIAIAQLVSFLATAIYWLVLIYVILSLLVNFNVINLQNDIVRQIYYGINSMVEPMLRPIRRVLPAPSGLDFSPLVLLLIVMFLRTLIVQDLLPAMM